jgi:hypothetical protein
MVVARDAAKASDPSEAAPTAALLDVPGLRLSVPGAKRRVNIIVHGASGTGKTKLAGSAEFDERMAPVFYIDFERGVRTLADGPIDPVTKLPVKPEDRQIRVFTISNYMRDLGRLQQYFDGNPKHPWKTIVVDSITEIGWKVMGVILGENGRPDGADDEVLERSEWNKWTNKIRFLIGYLRDLNTNLIVTSLTRDDYNQKTDTHVYRPSLQGQLSKDIGAFFDTVGYLTATRRANPSGEGEIFENMIRFGGSRTIMAKDRNDPGGLLPSTMKMPTATALLDRVLKAQTLEKK